MSESTKNDTTNAIKNNESDADLTCAKLDEMITVLKNIDEKLVNIARAIREINARG